MTMIRKRAFMGLLLFAWIPFIVRAVQIYVTANYPQAAMLAPTAETFRQFLEQQDFFVFIVTIYVGAGLIANDRRANALQIYLSKPLMRSRIHRRQGRRSCSRSCCSSRSCPAMLLLLLQVLFAGSFDVPEEQPVPVPGDHGRRRCCRRCSRPSRCWRCRRCRRAAATSASSTPASSSSPTPSTARCYAITGSTKLSWLSLGAQPRAGRRRHLPAEAALRDAVAGLAHRHPRPGRPVDLGARAARARRGGGHVSVADRHRRARLEVVRAGHRPERRHRDRAAGHHRAARPERRRQVDVHEADHRPAQAEQGRR